MSRHRFVQITCASAISGTGSRRQTRKVFGLDSVMENGGISEFRRNPISPLPQIEARPTLTFANVLGTSGRWSTIARDPCAIQSRRDRLSPAQPAPDEQSYGNRLRLADSSDVCRSAASRERP